jgi:8-oxo-dGTP pyrophosphatase MutT (NUDIX family)
MEKILTSIGNSSDSVCCVFVQGNEFLAGLRRYGPNKVLWTIPGGRCDDGEIIESALRREVLEETGLHDIQVVDYLGQLPGYKEGDKVHIFLCKTNQTPQLLEPDKFSEWRWVKVSDVKEAFLNQGVLATIEEVIGQQHL